MEHCITDFAFDPVQRTVWVNLDPLPSPPWVEALELSVVDSYSGAGVWVEGSRLSMPAGLADECNALGALMGLIRRADDTIAAATSGAKVPEDPQAIDYPAPDRSRAEWPERTSGRRDHWGPRVRDFRLCSTTGWARTFRSHQHSGNAR